MSYHNGEAVVLIRRREIAGRLRALSQEHPGEVIYVGWDNADTHEQAEVEDVLRAAAGRLVLLYLPTYSPCLNPVEMLRRHDRRVVTSCELFEGVDAMAGATGKSFAWCNQHLDEVRGHRFVPDTTRLNALRL